jgi:aryl-phospho-beta-D-glucosidase BglC (GH1 family)
MAAAELLPLRTRGTQIVNTTGAVVQLRGVNLGGWLLNELWMTEMGPQSERLSCDLHVRQVLARRFGAQRAAQLLGVYHQHYITPADFDLIARMGMTCVRLPIYYELLERDDRPGVYRADGWRIIDAAVSHCAARGLYCILDLHGAPGGQSGDHTTGQTGRNKLFFDKQFQDRTVALWQAIATRYAANSAVAGFDLLNEPWGAPTPDALLDLYERCYRAIRAVDQHHLIFLEDRGPGTAMEELPKPRRRNWRYIVYEFHPYLFDKHDAASHCAFVDERVRTYAAFAADRDAPVLVGEFHPQGGDESWRYYLTTFNMRGTHWTIWSYKCSARMGDWGLVRTGVAPNVQTDTYAQLRAKFAQYATQPGDINTNLVALITQCNTAARTNAIAGRRSPTRHDD